MPGFSRVGLDDIVMTSSDDDDYAAPTAVKKAAAVTKPGSRPVAREPAEPPNKRKRLSRIPSLSSDSSSSPAATPSRQLSPINVEDDDDIQEARSNEHNEVNDVSKIGTDSDEIPLLPAPLLTRLLHESFDDKQMKVSRDANALMARYMDVFVREAVARAALAKKERGDRDGSASNNNDDDDDFDTGIFLDTKDLEEVAPGLVLDF